MHRRSILVRCFLLRSRWPVFSSVGKSSTGVESSVSWLRNAVLLIKRSSERSEEHTSELQSPCNLVCRLLLEKKKKKKERVSRTDLDKDVNTLQLALVHLSGTER